MNWPSQHYHSCWQDVKPQTKQKHHHLIDLKSEFMSIIGTDRQKSEFMSIIGTDRQRSEFMSIVGTDWQKSEFMSIIGTDWQKSDFMSIIGADRQKSEFMSIIGTELILGCGSVIITLCKISSSLRSYFRTVPRFGAFPVILCVFLVILFTFGSL